MRADEIREMTEVDIRQELDDAREELMRMRFQLTTGELSDFNRLKAMRKDIARLETVLAEKAKAGVEDAE